ncbi:hypothetical protein SAMN05660284_02179 [Formivibrio citricus]|uniref:Lipoprotein n=1 Tax=Formivibrio citricus TaxID=83765 RepID=A0A1I5BJK3_9NEIS|nr:hypothetical protein SAMN05660284_02179 [Formivibrio citricus]
MTLNVIRLRIIGFALLLATQLAGCDQINDVVNKQKSNGKAVGAACRHSGRALEDCYQRNPKVSKSDIYAGWKEMNEYMQAKKLDVVRPSPDASGDAESGGIPAEKKKSSTASAPASAASSVKSSGKTASKASAAH